jgi:hypothetical protein
MKRLVYPALVLAASAAISAGCGGGGSSSSSDDGGGGGGGSGDTTTTTSTEPTGGGGVDGVSVGNCLNEDENFLVQPTGAAVDGQSPAGVVFTLTFYKDVASAQAVAAKKSKKTTAVVENGVVDFRGNPTPYAGAPPAKISQVELAAIKRCIDKARD